MKVHKKIYLLLVVVLITSLSCGIFSQGPGRTVEKFFEAVDRGEIDEALGYLSSTTIQTLGYDKWRAALTEASREMASEGGIRRVKVTDEVVNGDIAQVTFEVEYDDGISEENSIDLVKEDNEWKIDINPWMK